MASRGNLRPENFDRQKPTPLARPEVPPHGAGIHRRCQDVVAGHVYSSPSSQSEDSTQPDDSPTSLEQALNVTRNDQALVLCRPLLDSLYQDMTYDERFFVEHYERRLCPLLVLWDTNRNPYRSILPLIGTSEIVKSALITASVCHFANGHLGTPFISAIMKQGYKKDSRELSTWKLRASAAPLLKTYFGVKQRSLRLLARAMENPAERADVSTFVAIMLQLMVEFLETGAGAWSVHLEGAKKLIEAGVSTGKAFAASETEGIVKSVTEFDALGGTFLYPGVLTQQSMILRAPEDTDEVLDRSIVGCPVEVMRAIGAVSSMRQTDAVQSARNMRALQDKLLSIQSFSAKDWAVKVGGPYLRTTPNALEILFEIGQIWQGAGLLYTRRVLSTLTSIPGPASMDATRLKTQIARFDTDMEVLKCLLWPIFIVGAESDLLGERQWALSTLDRIWLYNSCANSKNSLFVLEGIWAKKDASRMHEGSEDGHNFDWISELSLLDELWMLF